MAGRRLTAPRQIEQLKRFYEDGHMQFPYTGRSTRAHASYVLPVEEQQRPYRVPITFLTEDSKGLARN